MMPRPSQFEVATGLEVAMTRVQSIRVVRLVFSPDGKTLLLSGTDSLELWSVAELLTSRTAPSK